MRKGKRMLAVMLAAVMTFGSATMTSYAKTIKISSVSIEVKSDIQLGDSVGSSEVEVKAKSSKYSVDSAEFTNESFEWQEDDTPTIEVRLAAADGYYFSVASKDITIKGGTYVTGKKEDSTHLLLTVKLPSLTEQAGKIENAGWEGETLAKWDAAVNAGSYEVKLYRDDVNVKLTQTSTINTLDMASCMTKAGTYNYKVRAVNKVNAENKSEWVESSDITVSNELATRMRAQYGSQTAGLSEPGQVAEGAFAAGWQQDTKGWWYRNENGGYTADDWQQINNQWYYFDSNGYMGTGWIQWKDQWYYCDLADGHMLTSALTPDGLRVDSQGIWIQ